MRNLRIIVWLPGVVIAGGCVFFAAQWRTAWVPETRSEIPLQPEFVSLTNLQNNVILPKSAAPMASLKATAAATPDTAELARLREKLAARKTELRAAFSAAAEISDPQARAEALTSLCSQWAEHDPRSALELALTHRLEQAPGAVIANLTQQWAVTDLAAAREWVDAQSPGDFRSELVARLGVVWARTDPQAAAQYVVSNTTAGPIQEEAAIAVLHQWAERDAGAAAEWVALFPEGALRNRAQRELEGVVWYRSVLRPANLN